ncbi:FKBP-type peptidyl-prolyl cis-trans isomerase [Flavobacteriaceae bacterium F08102]|nr:FKBP-type peptidyl-prolyl cis-trans isomerase [Flavobacteriaceae bacterium F08102]
MKKLGIVLGVAIVLGACQKTPKGDSANDGQARDTIKTESGLMYYYLKKGDGRKVERGASVSSYLSLMVGDRVIWNTDQQPDSLFTYLAGSGQVIKGFEEMGLLLREGDEVVAIMPPDIAYGEKGAGALIPPNSTIVYNQWKVKKVTEPKFFIADTLYEITKENGVEAAIVKYKSITSTQDSTNYFINDRQFTNLWDMLMNENLHEEAFMIADYFGSKLNNNSLKFSSVISLEEMGENKKALAALNELLTGNPNSPALNKKKEELEAKLTNEG